MKKVDYQSFTFVEKRFHKLTEHPYVSYEPFGDENAFENSAYIFNPRYNFISADKVVIESFGDTEIAKYNKDIYYEWEDYPYVMKQLNMFISQIGSKDPAIREQILSFVKLLATNPYEARFVGTLLVSIYNSKNFQSKKNPDEFATFEEKKELLDFLLMVLKANKDIKTFRRAVLYEMLFPEMFQDILFNEPHILMTLLNDENFQHSERNKSAFNVYMKNLKRKHVIEKIMDTLSEQAKENSGR